MWRKEFREGERQLKSSESWEEEPNSRATRVHFASIRLLAILIAVLIVFLQFLIDFKRLNMFRLNYLYLWNDQSKFNYGVYGKETVITVGKVKSWKSGHLLG